MKRINLLFTGALLLSSLFISQANAADDAQAIIDELQALTEKSRQERAADRWLQNALEDLVAKYNYPWQNSLLTDNFSDGDYSKGVSWQVESGDFWIDRRLGLRSRVEAVEKSEQAPAEETQRSDKEELGRALLGAFLQEALGPQEQAQNQQQPATEMVTTPAGIRTKLSIPTTFAVESIFSQNNRPGSDGHFEWIVMQDEVANNAYKLVVMTGTKPVLEVVRIRGGRESYIESKSVASLNDSGEHSISWRQKADGAIDVFLDGKQVIKASDRPFRYGFNYLGMVNRLGDFSVSGIEVLGGQ